MEPEGSLPHSQEPAICPCPEPDQLSQRPHLNSLISVLILSFHLRLVFRVVSFPRISAPQDYELQQAALRPDKCHCVLQNMSRQCSPSAARRRCETEGSTLNTAEHGVTLRHVAQGHTWRVTWRQWPTDPNVDFPDPTRAIAKQFIPTYKVKVKVTL